MSTAPRPAGGPRPTMLEREALARVLWFNSGKGYGFVTVPRSGVNAFLQSRQIEPVGYSDLPEGAEVIVDVLEGSKGPTVGIIHRIVGLPEGAREPTPVLRGGSSRPPRGGGGRDRDRDRGGPESSEPASPPVEATVKFYSSEKGFGFVAPDGGGKDLFVHATVLQRAGVAVLSPDQRVKVTTRMGNKGLQVESLEVLP